MENFKKNREKREELLKNEKIEQKPSKKEKKKDFPFSKIFSDIVKFPFVIVLKIKHIIDKMKWYAFVNPLDENGRREKSRFELVVDFFIAVIINGLLISFVVVPLLSFLGIKLSYFWLALSPFIAGVARYAFLDFIYDFFFALRGGNDWR